MDVVDMARQCRLSGDWEVYPVPLAEGTLGPEPPSGSTISVPDASHLQPVLYPKNPYWGDHIRAINQSAWMYRRRFSVPSGPYRRARLRFGGVDYFALVWLNGQCLGNHEGHFTPFDFDVTHALRHDDENLLQVCVSAPWDAPNPGGTYPSDHVLRGLVKGMYEHGEGLILPTVNPIGVWRPVLPAPRSGYQRRAPSHSDENGRHGLCPRDPDERDKRAVVRRVGARCSSGESSGRRNRNARAGAAPGWHTPSRGHAPDPRSAAVVAVGSRRTQPVPHYLPADRFMGTGHRRSYRDVWTPDGAARPDTRTFYLRDQRPARVHSRDVLHAGFVSFALHTRRSRTRSTARAGRQPQPRPRSRTPVTR
ncbi:MAG: hypothetical protein HND48_01420 [Chloroflexi bacterium]|nr:hypothetical protein [Chloroflexota bacterium]